MKPFLHIGDFIPEQGILELKKEHYSKRFFCTYPADTPLRYYLCPITNHYIMRHHKYACWVRINWKNIKSMTPIEDVPANPNIFG